MAKQTNSVEDWRILAERDLSVADHLVITMIPMPTQIITFHCQQAAEKYLKGALVFLKEEPPYTHDLDELCSIAEKHRPQPIGIYRSCRFPLESLSYSIYTIQVCSMASRIIIERSTIADTLWLFGNRRWFFALAA